MAKTAAANPTFAKNGWKYDRRLTAMMAEEMTFNPALAMKVLLQVRLPPHMELRVAKMWTTHQTIDDSGFSTGKSFTFAAVSAIRSILFSERISGLISCTFRQGQLMFKNYDRWYDTVPIFRKMVRHERGQKRIVHGSAAWEIFFENGSTIRALPPAFMQDSDRMRSERWNDGYFDEWTKYGNFGALTKTLMGRVTEKNDFNELCKIRQNHIHFGSTPGYTHDAAYKIVVKVVDAAIAGGDTNYCRFTSNYRHIPKRPDWRFLVARRTILSMQTMNPPGVVKSEIDGRWQKDSLSFYSARLVKRCRMENSRVQLERVNRDRYVFAFDMARGGKRGRKSGDDFSLTVWRISHDYRACYPCFVVRKSGVTTEQASGIIHDYRRKFLPSLIVYDPGGGGIFVRDELRKIKQQIRGETVDCVPILEYDDTSGVTGDKLLCRFSRGCMYLTKLWGKMTSESVLVNRAHKSFQTAIENQAVMLPPEWRKWIDKDIDHTDTEEMRAWLNQNGQALSEKERAKAELDLAVHQLLRIDVKRDASGEPILDNFGMYKFLSTGKKDAAYSMIYGYVGKLVLEAFDGSGLFDGGQESPVETSPLTEENIPNIISRYRG